ncbi:MAG: bestrophin family ion channel [Methylococcales bacterium]
MKNKTVLHSNKDESPGFLRGALMWQGSVTPRILPSLLLMSCYPILLVLLENYWQPLPHLDVTPFEYTGAVLGLVLVFRTNAGHERWWEARKLWGGINNQSRNLIIGALNYGPKEIAWREAFVKWTIAFAFATKESLRKSKNFDSLADLLGEQELGSLKDAVHMPLFVANTIAALLQKSRSGHQNSDCFELDGFEFSVLEGQRILLVDYLGGCERILKTPMPLVYAIKTRRFILTFLLLLPFSLLEKAGFNTVTIFFLVAYPLLSLDRIGIELQNPFDIDSLSHLPLDTICGTIKLQCLGLLEQSRNHALKDG